MSKQLEKVLASLPSEETHDSPPGLGWELDRKKMGVKNFKICVICPLFATKTTTVMKGGLTISIM